MSAATNGVAKPEKGPENAVSKEKAAASPTWIASTDKKKTVGVSQGRMFSTKGRGDVDSNNKRPSDKWLSSQEEQEDYDHVRILYRTFDHGVTALCETAEERQARAKQCKTTG
jgi:hypothetical protein